MQYWAILKVQVHLKYMLDLTALQLTVDKQPATDWMIWL